MVITSACDFYNKDKFILGRFSHIVPIPSTRGLAPQPVPREFITTSGVRVSASFFHSSSQQHRIDFLNLYIYIIKKLESHA